MDDYERLMGEIDSLREQLEEVEETVRTALNEVEEAENMVDRIKCDLDDLLSKVEGMTNEV